MNQIINPSRERLISSEAVMVAELFAGTFAAFMFLLVLLVYLVFKFVQTACSDGTAGKIIREIVRRWFGGGGGTRVGR
jgi:hypothetical protein